jgi:two-component system LytT family sensor kinase
MLLQPIVENSIKHGLSPKIGGGTVWLRSAVQGARLQLELEDDGVGIRPEAIPDVFRRGIGVSNVYERLQVLFGNEFNMIIEHRPGGGTRVRIQIPELKDPTGEAAARAALPSFAAGAVERG